jgi:hypothetical protein
MTRIALLLALSLLLCAFVQDGEDEVEDPEFKPLLPVKDTTDDTIKSYTDARALAPHTIAIHDEPAPGQYWEIGSDSYDITTSTRWQVTKLEGGRALVEHHMKLSAEMFKSDYVLAYRIQLKPEQGKPQVTKAWIGKPGAKPTEIFVRDMPEKVPPAPEEPKGEDFKDLELAGGKWSGKLYTDKTDDITTKIWVADGGWFSKVVKTTVDADYEEKLAAYGTDAKAILEWPEDVLK